MKSLLLRGSGLLKIKPELPESTKGIIYNTNSNRLLDRGLNRNTGPTGTKNFQRKFLRESNPINFRRSNTICTRKFPKEKEMVLDN